MAWTTFKLPTIPPPVTTSTDTLKTVLSTATTALNLAKTVTEAIAQLDVTALSVSELAIKSAVTAIQSALAALTADSGLYVLLVPPRSRVIIPVALQSVLSAVLPEHPTPAGLNLQSLFQNAKTTPAQRAILDQLFTATGGNASFVRAVVESLDDTGDINRPILEADSLVAGMYIVAGASNIADLLPFTSGMSSLLVPGKPAALDPPSLPVPQDVRAKVVAGDNVFLQWTAPAPISELKVLGTFAQVTEYAVIRSTSPTFIGASTPQELFNTNMLKVGMTSGDGLSRVLSIGTGAEYLDTDTPVPGTTYYYVTCFHVKLGTTRELVEGQGKDVGFSRLSNLTRIHVSKIKHPAPRSIAGTPPDWYRTPRVMDLFPALGALLDQVLSLTKDFEATTTGYGDLLKNSVAMLNQQIQKYADLASSFTVTSSTLQGFSSLNFGSVSSRVFTGSGGTDFLKQDIVDSFGDTTDPNRPPFDGEEFVCGVVLLATTADAIAIFNTLMGAVATGKDTVTTALAQIEVVLSTFETAVFGDDMQPTTHAAVPVVTSLPQIGPKSRYCYHPYEPSVTFDPNLTSRSTS